MANNVGRKVVQYYCDSCGKIIDLSIGDLYTYKKKFYHLDCLTKKLRLSKSPKYTQEEIPQVLEKALEQGKITRRNEKSNSTNKRPVKLPIIDKAKENKDKQDMAQLIEYVTSKYRISLDSEIQRIKRVFTMIKNGTYKKTNGNKISYEEMYKMLCLYEQELNYIHARLKHPIETQVALLFYDIAVLLNKYEEYKNKAKHVQKNEEIVDNFEVSTYLQGRNIDDDDNNNDLDIDAFLEGY